MSDAIDYIDINLHGDSIESNILTNPIELFFQEIEVSIKTGVNEIWGIKDSIKLSKFLFNKYVSLAQIKNEIKSYLNNNCQHSNDFQYTVNASIINSNNKDLIYIVVELTDVYEIGDSFKQKFLLGS